ncbi:MAG: anti-sigma factor [Acidobacteria bacterium]|nr:anti-sigma factor [Acidobacteriota bacterium]
MSTPDDLRDLYELYALGVLEEPERRRIEEALQSGSAEAIERLRQAIENNAILTASAPLLEPPPGLRKRVLAGVGIEQWWWGWIGALAAAAAGLLVAAFYLGNQVSQRESELAEARSQAERLIAQSARTNAELARLRHVLSFLNAPETRLVTFGPKDPKPPRGRLLVNPASGVLLIASNLPPAPAGRIYEMWLIPKSGKPIAAGLFQSDEAGNAVHLREGAVSAGAAVAVTLEPEAGSAQPTSTPLFVAGL